MLSTLEKWPKATVAIAAYFLLALLQWPSSYIIINISLSFGILFNEGLLVAGIPAAIAWWSKISICQFFPTAQIRKKPLLLSLIMTFAMVVTVDYLIFLSEKIFSPNPALKEMLNEIMTVHSFGEGLWRWALICAAPALCEEFFFRGFLQNTLAHRWNKNWGWVIAAFAFAIIHGVPQYLHLYFLLGLYLGWLFNISGNLWFPILAHLINNTWTFLTFLFDKKIPADDIWHPMDSLVLAACVVIFALAASRFGQETRENSSIYSE